MDLNNQIYYNMIYAFDVEVFSNMYFLENGLQRNDFIKIFILLNKYYPSYKYNNGNLNVNKAYSEQIRWEDIILNEYSLDANPYLNLYFNIPVFVQIGNQIEIEYTIENGIGITLEKDERYGFVFILNIYPNVYLNTNYYSVFDEHKCIWNKIKTTQTLAAIENRKILTSFLKELEALLKTKINQYESQMFDKNYIYKYGFYENVMIKY